MSDDDEGRDEPGRWDCDEPGRWVVRVDDVLEALASASPQKRPRLRDRQTWTSAEDAFIKAAVIEHGFAWRRIAADLHRTDPSGPIRSDDAIRNRYKRLEGLGTVVGQDGDKAMSDAATRRPKREQWSAIEDAIILENVARIGCQWDSVSKFLSNRTAHATRNRYYRLSTLLDRRGAHQI